MRSLFGSINTSEVSRRQAGFSLVELMVVITIIGVLAGIAVPRFQVFRARSQQAEAKSGLNGLFLSMQAYQSNYNQFCITTAAGNACAAPGTAPIATNRGVAITAIGFQVGGNSPRYGYRLVSNLGGWAAYASSNAAVTGVSFDYLRTNTNKAVCAPFDAVTLLPAPAGGFTGVGGQTALDGRQCPQTIALAAANANTAAPALVNPEDCGLGNTAATCLTAP
jgi:prepilin-type N-terminal cleavage/methylation domain-containing protein